MPDLRYTVLDTFPEPQFSALAGQVFSDYEPSRLLSDVLRDEAAARDALKTPEVGSFRVGVFQGDQLLGWTHARADGSQLLMINSGVAAAWRRRGLYTRLIELVLEHARTKGYVAVQSRHAADNNAVIIAKLQRGFFVSGFEYSEVYGPLVRLTHLPGELRRKLHHARSAPIRQDEKRAVDDGPTRCIPTSAEVKR